MVISMPSDTPEGRSKLEFQKFIVKKSDVKLFSNIRGKMWTGQRLSQNGGTVVLRFARCMNVGWGPDGSPDQIGWRQVTIKPEHVGTKIAQFCAVELKRFDHKGRTTVEQLEMRDFIRAQGGDAHIIDSIEQAEQIFGGG